jgi:hypothetical protein
MLRTPNSVRESDCIAIEPAFVEPSGPRVRHLDAGSCRNGDGGIRIPQLCSGISRFPAVYPRPYPRANVGLRTDRHRMISDSVG